MNYTAFFGNYLFPDLFFVFKLLRCVSIVLQKEKKKQNAIFTLQTGKRNHSRNNTLANDLAHILFPAFLCISIMPMITVCDKGLNKIYVISYKYQYEKHDMISSLFF